jgi:hypothetical protein
MTHSIMLLVVISVAFCTVMLSVVMLGVVGPKEAEPVSFNTIIRGDATNTFTRVATKLCHAYSGQCYNYLTAVTNDPNKIS